MTLEDFTKALKGTDELQITVTGRASGRKISRPVWFVQEGQTLYLLPVKGSDSDWYKNVLKTPTIGLKAQAKEWNAKAQPITDVARAQSVAEKFRAKYGSGEVKKYYSKFDACVEVALGRPDRDSQ
jgi:deazaflavin-dependent oxidoreductase (nitroreductase family)